MRERTHSKTWRRLAGCGALALGATLALAATPTTQARWNDWNVSVRVGGPRVGANVHFDIPVRIHKHRAFTDFYVGSFHSPRWGYVKVYDFPVRVRNRVVYVPYAYHNGRQVAHGAWLYDRLDRRQRRQARRHYERVRYDDAIRYERRHRRDDRWHDPAPRRGRACDD